MGFTDSHLATARFARDSKPDEGEFEHARLTSTLTRSFVEEFFGKYLKGEEAPHLDLNVRVEKE